MTGYHMAWRRLLKFRNCLAANWLCIWTAGMEPASGRRINRAWNVALNAALFLLPGKPGVCNGNTSQKSFCIGMKGMRVNLIGFTDFHQLS